MLDAAASQLTTLRWDLSHELFRLADHGFTSLAIWRPKLSDMGAATAAASLAAAGMRASSLQWAGGFTGGDGRSFAESVGDAVEAVEAAAILGEAASAARPPVLVLHSGCRGGHTRTHATRLLHDALWSLVPVARREGVAIAIKPLHQAAAPGCSFLDGLDEALDIVAAHDDPALGVAVDLWHFGDDPGLTARLPRLAPVTALVQVADRHGSPSAAADRLPAGHGTLPLERSVAEFLHLGYRGDVEFDPVGEAVEVLGYDGALVATRRVADAWAARLGAVATGESAVRADGGHAAGPAALASASGHFRRAGCGAGSRRSQASSQAVSPG